VARISSAVRTPVVVSTVVSISTLLVVSSIVLVIIPRTAVSRISSAFVCEPGGAFSARGGLDVHSTHTGPAAARQYGRAGAAIPRVSVPPCGAWTGCRW
jgi:hypothetical protein